MLVEGADFAGDGADEIGLVGWEVGEGLGAFGVLDLVVRWFVRGVGWWIDWSRVEGVKSTSLLPSSPYILMSVSCC